MHATFFHACGLGFDSRRDRFGSEDQGGGRGQGAGGCMRKTSPYTLLCLFPSSFFFPSPNCPYMQMETYTFLPFPISLSHFIYYYFIHLHTFMPSSSSLLLLPFPTLPIQQNSHLSTTILPHTLPPPQTIAGQNIANPMACIYCHGTIVRMVSLVAWWAFLGGQGDVGCLLHSLPHSQEHLFVAGMGTPWQAFYIQSPLVPPALCWTDRTRTTYPSFFWAGWFWV